MKIIVIFFFFLLFIPVQAQLPVGGWRDHLPYNHAIKTVQIGSKIYCATVNNIFIYDKHDNSIQKLSKITGLSEIGISDMEYNSTKNVLLIVYTNGNIDLIHDNVITNISDVKKGQ